MIALWFAKGSPNKPLHNVDVPPHRQRSFRAFTTRTIQRRERTSPGSIPSRKVRKPDRSGRFYVRLGLMFDVPQHSRVIRPPFRIIIPQYMYKLNNPETKTDISRANITPHNGSSIYDWSSTSQQTTSTIHAMHFQNLGRRRASATGGALALSVVCSKLALPFESH